LEQVAQTNGREGGVVPALYLESRPAPPASPPDDDLGLAAVCIEKGDRAGAAEHLKKHIKAHPEQIMIRAYLAELCVQMKRLPEAQYQFEEFIAAAQDCDGPARKHVLHCHTRLKEIAQERDDPYAEHLHRGIGMVILARRLEDGLRDDAEPGFRERLLCKASAELTTARNLRPDEPRPHWYLFEVWTKLGQTHAAEASLKRAKSLAWQWPLPPAEHRALALTGRAD
jgi:tetratricopeptide (TPR) repeat protein